MVANAATSVVVVVCWGSFGELKRAAAAFEPVKLLCVEPWRDKVVVVVVMVLVTSRDAQRF